MYIYPIPYEYYSLQTYLFKMLLEFSHDGCGRVYMPGNIVVADSVNVIDGPGRLLMGCAAAVAIAPCSRANSLCKAQHSDAHTLLFSSPHLPSQ